MDQPASRPVRTADRDEAQPPAARTWAVALWIVTALLLVILAVPLLAGMAQALDDRAWDLAVSMEQAALVSVAEVLDLIGDTLVSVAVMLSVAVILAWRRQWLALLAWVLATAASQALALLLKELYARPRPPLPLVETSGTDSFPSSQATGAAAIAIGTVLLPWPRDRDLRIALLIAIAYAVLVSLARVYLRAHWLTDVVAGLALGAACVMSAIVLVIWADRRWRRSATP